MRLDLLLLTVFWSIAYLFAIIHGFKYKEHAVPPFAISLNFSWEIVASIMYKEYIDIVWAIVDVFIVVLLIIEFIRERNKRGFRYLFSFFAYGVLCVYLFNKTLFNTVSGFVFLSFTMDLIMAINYIEEFPKRKHVNLVLLMVAIFKLLGDLSALYIYKGFLIIRIEGVLVLLLNVIYVWMVIRVLTKKNLLSDFNIITRILPNQTKEFSNKRKPNKKYRKQNSREWKSTKKKYKKKR